MANRKRRTRPSEYSDAPKIAQRVAPAGSVHWFDQLEGDTCKLAPWVAGGLWGDNHDKPLRAEGINRAWLAHWKETQ